MASSSSSSSSPCAACKFLRRKCTTECVFAPYFPPDQPHKFSSVHKIFGASNITKLLNDLPVHQREDAVNSLAYEADARVKDPVYGCVGAISLLQRQVAHLQQELAIAQQDLARYTSPHSIAHILPSALMPPPPPPLSSRELMSVREQYHEQQFTREQILEIARFGGGSYETGLAVLGLAGPSVGFSAPSLAAPPPHSSPRTGSDSSAAPPGISHLSPP